jgi:hypothetical protein
MEVGSIILEKALPGTRLLDLALNLFVALEKSEKTNMTCIILKQSEAMVA